MAQPPPLTPEEQAIIADWNAWYASDGSKPEFAEALFSSLLTGFLIGRGVSSDRAVEIEIRNRTYGAQL